MRIAALFAAGCTIGAVSPDESPATTWTITAIRDAAWSGDVDLLEAVVTSARTTTGDAFYVQDPGGGAGSGMRVELGGAIAGWPPEVGVPVALSGSVQVTAEGPVLILEDNDDAEILGPPDAVVATPWTDAPLGHDLTALRDLTVTSDVDPSGAAHTDGPVNLAGTFGWTPGWGRTGDATGILVAGRMALRGEDDWTGGWTSDPAVSTTIHAIRAGVHPEGTPVVLDDLRQLTPWSRGGRWAVVQDADGRGLWVDTEGWGLDTPEGFVGRWRGEVRTDDEGLRLRAWTAPEEGGDVLRAPIVGGHSDGDLVERALAVVSGPDAWGDWSTDGPRLDDRFIPLVGLPPSVTVRGVLREADDGLRLAVLALE